MESVSEADAVPSGKNASSRTGSASDAAAASPAGHRRRLLERYCRNGIDALHPHEIVELLLTYAIGRKDTKRIAKKLLERFKTISAICNAPLEMLQQIDGIGPNSAGLFMLVRDLLGWCLRERYERSSVIADRRDVETYLRFFYGFRPDEYVAALFLDAANHAVQTDLIAEGTVNQCAVFPRIVIEKALRCRAASMIIAHNHPAGTAAPSEQDWQLTERLFAAGKLLDIPLIDHIIICSETTVGLRDLPRWPGARG
ncbi:MAG: DNA repair protein RadC [Chitinispirillaceae bacterium]|nr:DNA repair protein RadC [Chitinispirillaceae bacterium]